MAESDAPITNLARLELSLRPAGASRPESWHHEGRMPGRRENSVRARMLN